MQIDDNPDTLKLDSASGLLIPVRYSPTTHYDERPANARIDMIVIHGISLPPAEFGNGEIENFFCGKLDPSKHPYFLSIADMKVSAHLLIDRKGGITQFVPFIMRAWHAGKSIFAGREQCNDFSIGIELEGTDDLLYEPEQYKVLAQVITLLTMDYNIPHDRIVGHSDIAPIRKTDPGPSFDWPHLRSLLQT